jgi:hypothetical protein
MNNLDYDWFYNGKKISLMDLERLKTKATEKATDHTCPWCGKTMPKQAEPQASAKKNNLGSFYRILNSFFVVYGWHGLGKGCGQTCSIATLSQEIYPHRLADRVLITDI